VKYDTLVQSGMRVTCQQYGFHIVFT